MRLFTFKLLIVSVVAGALMLAGATGAFANTGNQNSDFIVSVDLAPDTAAAGDQVSASASVTNTTYQWKFATLCLAVSVSDGITASKNACSLVVLPPKRTLALSYSFILPYSDPGTTVAVELSLSNSNGTSSASDSITLS
jgi:hypothetical protein